MSQDSNSPATKGDLAAVKADINALESRLKTDMDAMESRLTEKMRDMQTEVLGAFYGFSQSIQQRFKASDSAETALKLRVSTLEDRVLELEKRLNLPPQAA